MQPHEPLDARAGDLYQEVDADGNLIDHYIRPMVDGPLPDLQAPDHQWTLVQRSIDRLE